MYNTFGPPSASTWNNASGAVNAMGGALLTGASVAAPELLLEDTGLLSLGLEAGDEDTYVIGKVADLDKGLRPGEKKLDLLDQGNPKANWAQNSSKLRQAMNEGKPIRDVSAGNPGSNTGFLRAERNLFKTTDGH